CNHAVHSAPGSIVAEMRLVLDAFGGLVAASTTHQDARILTSLLGPAPIVELRPLNAAERRHLWQQALTTHLAPNQLAPLSDQLARRIRATPGAMVQGVRHASAQDSWTQAQQRADAIAAAVRSVNDHNLGELAEPTRTSLRWDEAVLAPETLARLEELVVHATHQGQVLDGWDMGRQLPYGRGLSCLFYGPPGTGKTMTAALVAQRLGLPLYRVELSKIVSKYIGETEKNLARLFDEAALAGGVLLFDEADSLFAKRTQVKGANDRYANLKVNYLLQRMEAYDGITILTTNLDKDLDEALRRRLRFRLYFPKPDLELRARLWATMLPPKALGTEPIDVEELAKKFDFAGGYIKNAILRAAFLAAQAGHPINTAMLNQAAVREARELGMLVRD
ncbi:MAG: ATP-binding protein, partial [Myxococcota bacterium]